jgi:hypothetical protein
VAAIIITNEAEISNAYERFRAQFSKGGQPFNKHVGWPGGGGHYDISWHSKLNIWGLFEPLGNRYFCAFGTDDPNQQSGLSPNCEINPPHSGINRRIAGLFVKDDFGNTYVAHRGKVGGGAVGVGKNSFLDWLPGGELVDVVAPDGRTDEVLLVAELDAPDFLERLSDYVHLVARYKQEIKAPDFAEVPEPPANGFKPEFTGVRKPYRGGNLIRASVQHGRVVAELKDKLVSSGFDVFNDQPRDLYICDDAGSVQAVFEVKTSADTTSVYTGIGQLMLHGAELSNPAKRVLVVPGIPTTETSQRIERIGIHMLDFDIAKDEITFSNFDEVVDDLEL